MFGLNKPPRALRKVPYIRVLEYAADRAAFEGVMRKNATAQAVGFTLEDAEKDKRLSGIAPHWLREIVRSICSGYTNTAPLNDQSFVEEEEVEKAPYKYKYVIKAEAYLRYITLVQFRNALLTRLIAIVALVVS